MPPPIPRKRTATPPRIENRGTLPQRPRTNPSTSRMLLPRPFLRLLPGLLFVILAASGFLRAQITTMGANRVTFYTEPNFRGEALTVEAGANLETLDRVKRSDQRPWTFGISSVRVEGQAIATVYATAGFGGDRLEITTSIADLYATPRGNEAGATWDRCIVSLAVIGPRVATPSPAPRIDSPPNTVYVVPVPVSLPPQVVVRPPPPRYDRRTAEAIVQRAYREVLVRNADPSGLRHYREKLIREGWTERQLIADLQRSDEARAVRPEDAIARAYRDVLGREPDPSGLNHYRGKWREGWTQGQIREELRRSEEGLNREVREIITRAYRDLLGRGPDPEGYAAYERLLRREGGTERDLRAAIMAGEEYRQRRKK